MSSLVPWVRRFEAALLTLFDRWRRACTHGHLLLAAVSLFSGYSAYCLLRFPLWFVFFQLSVVLLSLFILVFAGPLLSVLWLKRRKQRFQTDAHALVKTDGRAFLLWFTICQFLFLAVSGSLSLCLVFFFGPQIWLVIIIAPLQGLGLLALLGLWPSPPLTSGLLWQVGTPEKMRLLDEEAFLSSWTLRGRYRWGLARADKVMVDITRILDLARIGGSPRRLTLWHNGFKNFHDELFVRIRSIFLPSMSAWSGALVIILLLPSLNLIPPFEADVNESKSSFLEGLSPVLRRLVDGSEGSSSSKGSRKDRDDGTVVDDSIKSQKDNSQKGTTNGGPRQSNESEQIRKSGDQTLADQKKNSRRPTVPEGSSDGNREDQKFPSSDNRQVSELNNDSSRKPDAQDTLSAESEQGSGVRDNQERQAGSNTESGGSGEGSQKKPPAGTQTSATSEAMGDKGGSQTAERDGEQSSKKPGDTGSEAGTESISQGSTGNSESRGQSGQGGSQDSPDQGSKPSGEASGQKGQGQQGSAEGQGEGAGKEADSGQGQTSGDSSGSSPQGESSSSQSGGASGSGQGRPGKDLSAQTSQGSAKGSASDGQEQPGGIGGLANAPAGAYPPADGRSLVTVIMPPLSGDDDADLTIAEDSQNAPGGPASGAQRVDLSVSSQTLSKTVGSGQTRQKTPNWIINLYLKQKPKDPEQ